MGCEILHRCRVSHGGLQVLGGDVEEEAIRILAICDFFETPLA